jgi:sensor histidine kinase YesM
MVINWKVVLKESRDVILLAAAGFVMTMTGLTCVSCMTSTRDFWIIGSFTALMWISLWKGNSCIPDYITHRLSWLHEPVKKFLYNLAFTTVYTLSAVYGLAALYKMIFHIDLSKGIIYSVIITIIISLFMHGRGFLINWKQTAIAAEKHERESMAAKYESLRNQVNPHFLFNSFNALSNLVYEDPDKAVKFIKQLSNVYRYVLDTREKEIVSLAEELKFLESYVYLQKIRFGDKLRVNMSVSAKNESIAPLALQMLFENAIKHNVISDENPLDVRVFDENGFVIVENNLQRKMSLGEPSAGVGLDNICKRYEFLSDTKVQVIEQHDKFIVKLPLLNPVS